MNDAITYVESRKSPGRYTAYDHRGNVCGFVSQESMDADIAWRKRTGRTVPEVVARQSDEAA